MVVDDLTQQPFPPVVPDMLSQGRPRRVVVVGTSGSGKTTMALRLAEVLGSPHFELDALSWGPDWTEVPRDVLRERVEQAVARDEWVVDGNYGCVREIVWPRADTVVWLDYPFRVVFGRLLHRTLRRSFWQEDLWHGNRESLVRSFFSRESILLWCIQTYGRRRRSYPQLFRRPEYAHLRVIHLRSPRQVEPLLAVWAVPGC